MFWPLKSNIFIFTLIQRKKEVQNKITTVHEKMIDINDEDEQNERRKVVVCVRRGRKKKTPPHRVEKGETRGRDEKDGPKRETRRKDPDKTKKERQDSNIVDQFYIWPDTHRHGPRG